VKAVRQARHLGPEQLKTLDAALLRTLVALSDAGKLNPVPLNLSFTKSKVVLKSVSADEDLIVQIEGGSQTARMKWRNIAAVDRATLSLLVASLKPDSQDAQAMAGVYMEQIGKLEQSDSYYEKAGETSRKKLEALFQ
jgi:hypothetical protein